jgi:hypothetical protein
MAIKYYIERRIGLLSDTLACLWEGSDLPSFRRNGNPYLFSDRGAALRVLSRLEARYPTTIDTPRIPSQPIQYELMTAGPNEDWECKNCESRECGGCISTGQNLGCFV